MGFCIPCGIQTHGLPIESWTCYRYTNGTLKKIINKKRGTTI